ncbi:hypothetical protein BJF85_08095 [Saccharomonospora sp. CUA-673]|uniref:Imm1 family immunity protein n=1 Tax=Saccharomonospora sp. CUA-673 TaxID=1904969 RepID=UPI00095D6474|nr:Imm1 family immunity protein [Saccharomonospora sp. CUA-673]OLT38662.1 hypothetical protein BJF85_08095 [Saccharomonospora sp. CUA-673]
MAVTAWYDVNGPATVTTTAELDAVLDTVAAWNGANLIELSDTDDPWRTPMMNVGLDAERGVGVLVFLSPQGNYVSSNGSEDETPQYFYQDHEREFPAGVEVPIADARRAAREYVETRARPACVQWQPYTH